MRAASVKKYRLSFTFGGLLVPESRTIAEQYAELGDWQEVKNQVLAENLMGKTRRSTSRRYFRELRDRLTMAYSWEIDLVAGRDPDITTESDIPIVLFAIVARYYQLIGVLLRRWCAHAFWTVLQPSTRLCFGHS